MADKKDRTVVAALTVVVLQTVAIVLLFADSRQLHADVAVLWPTIREFVSGVPTSCWWWTAGGSYLAYAWLWVGPQESRSVWREIKRRGREKYDSAQPFLWWLSAPLWIALLWVLTPMAWLAYGSDKSEAKT